jgi:hypothetical protein
MSEPRVRFAKLRQLLLALKFSEIVVPDSHIGFRHDPSDTTIMLPTYKRNEIVAPRHLVPVRTLLDGKGLLDADKFDQMLAAAFVERSAS